MQAFVLGLVAAAMFGAADFYGGLAAKRASMFAVAAIGQGVGLAALAIVVPFLGAHPQHTDWLLGFAAGACGGLGIALLYHALSIGKMGVVSPITAVLAAALPVFTGIFRGDHLTVPQLAGIVVALVAIVLISLTFETSGVREIATEGVREAIASGILIGGFLVFVSFSHKEAGLSVLLAARIASVAMLVLIALARRSSLRPSRGVLGLIVGSGAMDTTATALYVIAMRYGALSIVAVLISLYPASTVFLARVMLKERLQPSQVVGVVLALVGVALIAF